MTKNIMHICFATDNNYAPYMGISIYSILKTSDKNDKFHFHILDNSINKENKQKIIDLKNKYRNFKISFYPISTLVKICDYPLKNKHLSMTAYARLYLGSILPTNITKVLYLDCDIIVRASLYPIFQENISHYILGGVEDNAVTEEAKRGLNFWDYKSSTYVNSGVLLINLKQWRKENIERQLLAYLKAPLHPIFYEDQDVINFVLKKKIKILSPRWNGLMYLVGTKRNSYININKLRKNVLVCPIVHFASPSKPWIKFSGMHQNVLYYSRLMQETPWFDLSCGSPNLFTLFFKYLWVHPFCIFKFNFWKDIYLMGFGCLV